jgi:hypothetical protein
MARSAWLGVHGSEYMAHSPLIYFLLIYLTEQTREGEKQQEILILSCKQFSSYAIEMVFLFLLL